MSEPIEKLYRSRTDRIIFGVCGGLADYFHVDVTLVRAVFLLLTFLSGVGVLLYIILSLITPLNPSDKLNSDTSRMFARRLSDEISKTKLKERKDSHAGKNFLGLSVLMLGIIFLARYYFGLKVNWSLVSPILVIILGIYLIIKHK